MDLVIQLGFIFSILFYGVVLSRYIPEKFHFLANVLAALASILAALLIGLSFHEIGLSLKLAWKGLLVAITASIILLVCVFVVSRLNFAKKYFMGPHSALRSSSSRLVYETAVRIPLSTALSEEILFRGVLLGVLLSYNTTLIAIIVSSVVFGLWHILPAHNTANKIYYKQRRVGDLYSRILHISGNVLATAFAGVMFAWLRILSGSILAPWLVHWTINSSALVSSLFTAKRGRST